MATAQSVIDVMLGEAGGKTAEERYNDMLHIASSIVNRARMTGQSIEDIALSQSQYNAFGKALPGGVGKYRDLAQQALDEVLTKGPVNKATYYATPAAVDNLPGRLAYETATKSHQYFSDPELRGIVTRKGARQPGLLNTPTPEFRQDPWASAVPGEVERGLLSDVPAGLQTPAVSPQQGYGLLAETMGQTPSLNMSGAGVQSAAADRMAGGEVANGMDQLRSGLLSSGSMPSREAQMAEMQAQANFQNEVNMARQSVSQPRTFEAYQPEQQASLNNGVAAIEAVSPSTQQAQPRSLADAYSQLGSSLDQGGILGLSGMKQYDPNEPLGKLANQNPFESLPAYEPSAVDTAAIEGPVTSEIAAPEDTVEQDQAGAVQGNTPSRFGNAVRNFGVSALGGIAGSTLGGPVGAMIGSALAREAFGVENAKGSGLLDGGGFSGLLGGLTGTGGGQGAWGGVGALNNIGSGAQASYGAWGGPKGTTAMASDGSRITSLGDGLVSRINKNGVETLFRGNQTYGGGGGGIGGGFFSGLSGLLGGTAMGDGSRSQADRARDSVGLY